MNEESLDDVERQIARVGLRGGGSELRAAVLAGVERELRASRWDRRLARVAVLLLVIGVGMNVAVGLRSDSSRGKSQQAMAQSTTRQSLVTTAAVVAEATDAATGSRFARQLAVMSGHDLTAEESAAVDAAVRRAVNGNRG